MPNPSRIQRLHVGHLTFRVEGQLGFHGSRAVRQTRACATN